MAESVELAAILLTDLVGSTRLASSVGPVRADQLREEHFGLLRDAIAAWEGEEVKNTGDGLMVAFTSASAAVKCAVVMQQLSERRYRRAEQSLHVRIGLGAGESTVKDGDYFGMPTVEAARLCAQAPADGILISALGKTLAGRCDGVDFCSAGELELDGFPDPVAAFSVSWAPLAEETGAVPSRWPLSALLRSLPPVSYVGRVEERGALEEAMVLARDRARQAVLLSGEPGIGKSRLASFAAHRAHAEGFAVAGAPALKTWRCPMSPGSRCARTWSSTLPRSCLPAMSSGTRASSADWLETWSGGSIICPRPRHPTPRPSVICSSPRLRGCLQKPHRRCRCAWCWTTCIGPTVSRWRF